jgi:hypothetical protein
LTLPHNEVREGSTCESCPCCLGCGQITGPKSAAYSFDPGDPFNRVVRLCDECEGTGVITKVRAAGLHARAMHAVLPIVDRVMDEWRDEVRAVEAWEAEGGLCV